MPRSTAGTHLPSCFKVEFFRNSTSCDCPSGFFIQIFSTKDYSKKLENLLLENYEKKSMLKLAIQIAESFDADKIFISLPTKSQKNERDFCQVIKKSDSPIEFGFADGSARLSLIK